MEYPIFYAIAVLILIMNYRIKPVRGVMISLALSVFLVVKYFKVHPYDTSVYVFFLMSLPFITRDFKNKFDIHKEKMREKFSSKKEEHEELLRQDRIQVEGNAEREKKLQQLLSLYEISKDMSTCLFLDDILDIFSATLKKSFRFKSVRFVMLRDSRYIDSVHQIEFGQKTVKSALNELDVELLNVALEIKRMIYVFPQDTSSFSRRLTMVKDFDSLVSIPIFSEGSISAVLYVENLPRAQFDNFVILATQFAIQFQKIMLYKKVQDMSITDSLTDISTRRYFLEKFSEEIKRSMRHKAPLSFLMLDIDHFKEKNDKFGHLVGDVILKKVATILKENLREIDIIGRYGGEELAIVLSGIDKEGAFQVAERIRENIEGTVFEAYDEVVSVTVSIGVSVFPDDGVDMDSLIEYADKSLYKAKESGRNKVC